MFIIYIFEKFIYIYVVTLSVIYFSLQSRDNQKEPKASKENVPCMMKVNQVSKSQVVPSANGKSLPLNPVPKPADVPSTNFQSKPVSNSISASADSQEAVDAVNGTCAKKEVQKQDDR